MKTKWLLYAIILAFMGCSKETTTDGATGSLFGNWDILETIDPITDQVYTEMQNRSEQGAIFRHSSCPSFTDVVGEYIIEWPGSDLASGPVAGSESLDFVNGTYRIGDADPVNSDNIQVMDVEDARERAIQLNQELRSRGMEGDLDPDFYQDNGLFHPFSAMFYRLNMRELIMHDGNRLVVRIESSGSSGTLTAIFDLTGIVAAQSLVDQSCRG